MFGVAKRLGGRIALVAVLGLTVFHIALLWRRLADQSIAEPRVWLRWVIGVAVLGLLVGLHRRAPAHRGLGIVVWLIVILLHAGGPGQDQIFNAQAELVVMAQTVTLAALLVLGRFARVPFTHRPRAVALPPQCGAPARFSRRRTEPPRSPPLR